MASRLGTASRAALVMGALGVFLSAPAAESAQIKIDNGGLASLPGSLGYDGEGGAVFGENIEFIQITGINTPFHNGSTLICSACFLNFQTGPNISEGPFAWTWGGGGFFVLTGTILGTPEFDEFSGVILNGTFSGSPAGLAFGTSDVIFAFNGVGLDLKAAPLVAYYYGDHPDVPPEFQFTNTEITGTGQVFDNNGFLVNVDDADIKNTRIPEPGTALLMLLGLGSLASYRRRRS
jgi:PEP-CTERM motif